MTDILIRGMEMPKRCDATCPLYNTSRGFYDCKITRKSYNWGLATRPSDCPLYELPPHGDLIDRDALFKQMGVTDMDCYKCEFGNHGFCGRGEFSAACEAIEVAPVIVQANEEETE